MYEIKDIKQTAVFYGMHSPYVRELVKASRNRGTLHDWHQLFSVVVEDGL